VRLRQILHLPRHNRVDDPILTITQGPIDLDFVKACIANANVGQALSGVRWELYGDSDLVELVAQGRFDLIDLLPADLERTIQLVRNGHLNAGPNSEALDFDNLRITHTCPVCHKPRFGRDLLLFIPKWMRCDACGNQGRFVWCHVQAQGEKR
jgi:hypothetical protein